MKPIALAVILNAALLGNSASQAQEAYRPGKDSLKKVTIAFTTQPQSTLVHIADAKGFFLEEGIELRSSMHSFGKAALKEVMEGNADFATVAETPVMFSIFEGKKLFLIANLVATTTNNAVIARKDSGITKPSDLKGKRVGYTPGTSGDFFLDSLLTASGLTRSQIQLVALKPDEMQPAILEKKVDAASTWNYPLTIIKEKLGANGVIFYDRELYTETFNLAASQDFVTKNPDVVKNILRALIKAEKYISQNPEAAQGIMADRTKQDLELVHNLWGEFKHKLILDHTILLTLEDEARWAMKNKLVAKTEMPNFRDYLYVDGLKSVRPESIKLKH